MTDTPSTSGTPGAPSPQRPRYIDREHDVWTEQENGTMTANLPAGNIMMRSRTFVERTWGPLTPMDASTPVSASADSAAASDKTQCLNCQGTGNSDQGRGWAGGQSSDMTTCPDCRGTGIDKTPFGVGADHCPHCGADWKQDHSADCMAHP